MDGNRGRRRVNVIGERVLVIDSSLNARRIASELKKRGRNAISLYELEWDRYKDPPLLRAISDEFEDAVLVTADDTMPLMHEAVVKHELAATIATVEPWDHNRGSVVSKSDQTSDQEAYEREIVHRWVHRMEEQERATIRRYFLGVNRKWTRRFP